MSSIGIIGISGRMGRAIADAARAENVAYSGIDRSGNVAALASVSSVLVDFSSPVALPVNIAAARRAGTAMLIGTTGLSDADHALIDEAAEDVPILQAANTSLGVNLLAALVREAASRLGAGWDIEVLEMHHRAKVDAPSGTALMLGEAAAEGRGIALDAVARRSRDGAVGARPVGEIGFATLRGGSVAGDHMVILAGDGERIELGHRAESREIFARGAVRAALWLRGRAAGRYAMGDMLSL